VVKKRGQSLNFEDIFTARSKKLKRLNKFLSETYFSLSTFLFFYFFYFFYFFDLAVDSPWYHLPVKRASPFTHALPFPPGNTECTQTPKSPSV
jgi:hypothetical protein